MPEDLYGAGEVAAPQPDFLPWSAYQQARSGVDPSDAYNEYITSYAPARLSAMGATPEQVEQFVTGFKQRQPKPARQPRDEGLLKNIGKAVSHEFDTLGRTMAVGPAMATGNVERIAEIAKLQSEEVAASPSQARFRKKMEGAKWHDLIQRFAQSAGQEPEGAFESTLQTLIGFMPFVAGGAAGSLAGPLGTAAGVGLTAGELRLGAESILALQEAVREAGIDLDDQPAVAAWLSAGGLEKVFGKAIGPAATEAAVATISLGIAGKIGGTVAKTLTESGLVGDAERAAIAASREATRVGTATAGGLRRQAAGLKAAEIATGAGGFAAAGGLADITAGREPDDAAMFANVLMMAIPGGLHARSQFKKAGKLQPSPKPKAEVKQEEQKQQTQTEELTEERLRALANEARPKEEGLKPEDDVFNPQEKPFDPTQDVFYKPEEDVFRSQEKPFDPTQDVFFDPAQDVFKQKAEPPTREQIEGIEPFEVEAAAVKLVQDAAKEARNERIEEVVRQVESEVAERKTKRAAASAKPRKGLKRQPADRPVEAARPSENVVDEAASRPGGDERYTLVEEGVRTELEGQPRRGEPTGSLGERSPDVAGEPPIPKQRAAGEGGAVEPFRFVGSAFRDQFSGKVYRTGAIHDRNMLPPEAKGLRAGVLEAGFIGNDGNFYTRKEAEKRIRNTSAEQLVKPITGAELHSSNLDIGTTPKAKTQRKGASLKKKEVDEQKVRLPREEEFAPDELTDLERSDLGIGKRETDYAPVQRESLEVGIPVEILASDGTETVVHIKARNQEEANAKAERFGYTLKSKDGNKKLDEGDKNYAPPTWSVDTSSPGGVRLRPSFPAAVETVIRSGRATGERLLEWFATKSDVPEYRVLAQDMLPQMRGRNVPIRIVDELIGPDGKSKRGYADSDKNVIGLDKKYGVDQETLFHELVHILTVNSVENPRTFGQRVAAGEMKKLYEFVKAQTRPELFKPMLKNIKEFIAEAHANPNFQDHLVDLSNALKSGRNAWQVFKDLVNRLIFRRPVDENVLEKVLRTSKDLYEVREGREVDYGRDFAVNRDRPYVTYDIVDSQTGRVVGSYTNKTRARNEVDKRDNEYGGVRYRRDERIVYPEDWTGPRDTARGGLLSNEALERIGLKRRIGGFDKIDYAEGSRKSARPYLDASKYFYHAVRNDADIADIVKNGLRPGTNVSIDTRGQAFNEGETILVFRKGQYKTSGKGYQEDHIVTSGSGGPVAILKDTEPFHKRSFDEISKEVETTYEKLQEEAQLIARTLDMSVEDFWKLARNTGRYGNTALAKERLGEWYERARSLNKREDALYERMDRMPEPDAGVTGPEDILSRYDSHGLPVAGIRLGYDEKTGFTTVHALPLSEITKKIDYAEGKEESLNGGDNDHRYTVNGHVYFQPGARVIQDSFPGNPAKVIRVEERKYKETLYELEIDTRKEPEAIDENGVHQDKMYSVTSASRLIRLNPPENPNFGFSKDWKKIDYAESDAQAVQTAAEVQKKGRGDVIGRVNGEEAFIAWRRDDGHYDAYRTSRQEPTGEKASKQVFDNEEQLRDWIESQGGEVEFRGKRGFFQTPGNTDDLISRWKGGKLAYTAVMDEKGKWHAQSGEDLQTRTAERKRATYDTREEALAAADKVSPHEGRQQSETAENIALLSGLSEDRRVVVGTPAWVNQYLTNENAPVAYVAGRTNGWLKEIGARAPEGLQLDVELLLKTSDIGREAEHMVKYKADPMLNKLRQLMRRSPFFNAPDKYERLDKLASAIHASERLGKLIPKYPDETKYIDPNNTSLGYTDYYKNIEKGLRDAQDYVRNVDQQTVSDMRALLPEWKQFSNETIDIMVDGGRLDPIVGARMKAAYETYIPLVTGDKAAKNKMATGQSAEGTDVFSRIIEARVHAMMDAVDNKAMRVLGTWARTLDYRNPDGTKIFRVNKVDYEHLRRDPETGMVEITTVKDPHKTVVYYEDGKPISIEVNNDGILQALKRFHGPERLSAIKHAIGAAGIYTRMFSALHTSLSLAFGPKNFVRDYGVNVMQLDPRITYPTFHKAMISPATWEAAFRHGFKEAASLLGKDTINTGTSKGAKLAQDVDQHRPLIERRFQYGHEQIVNDYRTSLRPSIGSKAEKYLAPGDGKLTNFISGLTHSLEAVNRIAVFKAARESGIGDREAAVLAKNSTVNFEQRGALGGYINPLFVFSNAKMQSNRTLAQNLGFTELEGPSRGGFRKGLKGLLPGTKKPESANKRTIRSVQLMLAAGLASAFMNYKSSDKSDDGRTKHGKRSDFQLDNYLFIPGTDFAIPIPQETGLFYILGNAIGDALWGDRSGSASPPVVRFITAAINNFWPGGTSMHDPTGERTGAYFTRLITPTQLVAVSDIVQNRDTFGRTINPQRDSPTVPPEFQGAKNASPFANMMAKGLAVSELTETSPAAIDHIIKDLFKSQKGAYNAILDGNVGALLGETVKSFKQDVFPGTNKLDFEAVAKKVARGDYRIKGSPLKKGERSDMFQTFYDTDVKLKALSKKWNATDDKVEKEKISAQQNELRVKALRKYYEATGVIK